MWEGQHEAYYWIESDKARISDLLDACPAVLLNKYVVITACDSSPLHLSAGELASGWTRDADLAYSPAIIDVHAVPRGEYDEWYVFSSPIKIAVKEIFVNYGGFSLRDPAHWLEGVDSTWDTSVRLEHMNQARQMQDRFWAQLSSINPESYIMEGDKFIIATKNGQMHRTLQDNTRFVRLLNC